GREAGPRGPAARGGPRRLAGSAGGRVPRGDAGPADQRPLRLRVPLDRARPRRPRLVHAGALPADPRRPPHRAPVLAVVLARRRPPAPLPGARGPGRPTLRRPPPRPPPRPPR